VEQHAIFRTGGPIQLLPLYFVDNVITTGTTIAACRRALGWGIGLAYADASRCPHPPRFGMGIDRCVAFLNTWKKARACSPARFRQSLGMFQDGRVCPAERGSGNEADIPDGRRKLSSLWRICELQRP
jgi:hypothetical protein